jgi:hypothetical protein
MMRRPLIIPHQLAASTLEQINNLALAAIEHGLNDTSKGAAGGASPLRILRLLGRRLFPVISHFTNPSPPKKNTGRGIPLF